MWPTDPYTPGYSWKQSTCLTDKTHRYFNKTDEVSLMHPKSASWGVQTPPGKDLTWDLHAAVCSAGQGPSSPLEPGSPQELALAVVGLDFCLSGIRKNWAFTLMVCDLLLYKKGCVLLLAEGVVLPSVVLQRDSGASTGSVCQRAGLSKFGRGVRQPPPERLPGLRCFHSAMLSDMDTANQRRGGPPEAKRHRGEESCQSLFFLMLHIKLCSFNVAEFFKNHRIGGNAGLRIFLSPQRFLRSPWWVGFYPVAPERKAQADF